MKVDIRMRVSAQDGTTATLVPVAGTDEKSYGLADKISQIVVAFANARDAAFFSETNRQFDVSLARL